LLYLYKHKSNNNHGFLTARLKAEGVVANLPKQLTGDRFSFTEFKKVRLYIVLVKPVNSYVSDIEGTDWYLIRVLRTPFAPVCLILTYRKFDLSPPRVAQKSIDQFHYSLSQTLHLDSSLKEISTLFHIYFSECLF